MCRVIFTFNVRYLFCQMMVITIYIIQMNWNPILSARTVRSSGTGLPCRGRYYRGGYRT